MNQQEIRDAIEYFERLKRYAAEYEKEYPESKQAPEKIDLAITALRAQIEPGWIKVSEPPKAYGEYLVFVKFCKGAKQTRIDVAEWYDEWKINYDWTVTHWMPLPEPPKDGEE